MKKVKQILTIFIIFIISVINPNTAKSVTTRFFELFLGSKTAYVDGKPIQLDQPPITINGRTMVPLRFITEQIGATNLSYEENPQERVTFNLPDSSALLQENAMLKEENQKLKERIKELENQKPPLDEPPNDEIKPDLVALKFRWSPSEASEGKEFNIEVCIKNNGNASAKSSTASLYIGTDNDNEIMNDYLVCNKPVQSLSIGDEVWISHSFYFPDLLNTTSGQYQIWIECLLDSSNEVVELDENNRWKTTSPVVVNEKPNQQPPQQGIGKTRDNPVPFKQAFITPDGFQITVTGFVGGFAAWDILKKANRYNDPPSNGMQYVLVSMSVINISSKDNPSRITSLDFSLVGSSNKIFRSFDKAVVQPEEGVYKDLKGEIYHNGEIIGSLAFYIPSNEANIQIIWDYFMSFDDTKVYFAVDSSNSLPPSPPSNNDWQHQYTFPNRYNLYNLKDVYIKEDNANYYFNFTSYDVWKYSTDLVLSFWIDKDQNIYTGPKTENGIPMGDDIIVTFFYNEDRVYIGGIGEWDESNNEFIVSYIYSFDEYNIEPNSLTFSIPKEFFIRNHAFNYMFMLSSNDKNFKSEAYPGHNDKLTYPKIGSNRKINPNAIILINNEQKTTHLEKFNEIIRLTKLKSNKKLGN